jgi:L-rhamnose-H+ transport protein
MINAIIGTIFHSLGGFAAGSFYMPYKKVKAWSWETYWIIGGVFSWLLIPILAAALTVPGYQKIISSTESNTLLLTYLFGLLWGISGLTFGLSMRYLGLSLGMSIALGFCSAFGALVPSFYYYFYPKEGVKHIGDMLSSSGGLLVLLSVLICLIGIGICGKAGMMKEKESNVETPQVIEEFDLKKGLLVATMSGFLSAFFSFGIAAGKPMADVAIASATANGSTTLFVNNVVFVIILLGGLTTNAIYSIYKLIQNKSYPELIDSKKPLANNYIFSALAGTTWFLQFFFYGMGETQLGSGASSWILHMSTIIITSNLWGLKLGEWDNVSQKTKRTILIGVGVIILSVIVSALGSSLA